MIGIDDDNLVGIVGQIDIGSDCAGRAQERWFVRLAQMELPLSVDLFDVGTNGLGQGMGVDSAFADAGLGQTGYPGVEQRPAGDGNQAVGNRGGQGIKAGFQSTSQKQSFDTSRAGRHGAVFSPDLSSG